MLKDVEVSVKDNEMAVKVEGLRVLVEVKVLNRVEVSAELQALKGVEVVNSAERVPLVDVLLG